MKSYLNEFTREFWRGNPDKRLAPDYVAKSLPAPSAPWIYTGRLNGQPVKGETAEGLKTLEQMEKEIRTAVWSEKKD